MTKDQLIDYISNDLTGSCSLPFSPKRSEIERIIDIEARFLYREYRDVSRTNYYILDKKYYHTQEWKNTRTFQMPDCVMGIKFIYEMTGGSNVFGINDPDVKFDRLMASDLYLSPLSSDQITYRTISWSFWDLARAFNLRDINHDFNINTHRLVITGRDPAESLYMQTLDKIPEEDFYEDTLVISWFTQKAKLSLAKVLGYFNYQLLGNVTINYEAIRIEAKEELAKLEAKISSDNACDWFMTLN
jgi:hypothetical protein